MKPVRLRAAAKRDLREATAWYQDRSEEIADRFVAEVTHTLELIEQFPMTGGRFRKFLIRTCADYRCTTFLTTWFFCD